jgi:uncharacterized protein
MVERAPNPEEMNAAAFKRAAFMEAIPAAMLDAEDALPRKVRELNASARSKLQRVYLMADELSAIRSPFVACAKGCASCCHMNVSITRTEAERIAKASGRCMSEVGASRHHATERHAGTPCPFLEGGACSIYDDRPLSCRKHASFFETAAACDPSVMNAIEVPQVAFSGLDQALFAVSGGECAVQADIRDFFPRG